MSGMRLLEDIGEIETGYLEEAEEYLQYHLKRKGKRAARRPLKILAASLTAAAAAAAVAIPANLARWKQTAAGKPALIEKKTGEAGFFALTDEHGISFRDAGTLAEYGRLDDACIWEDRCETPASFTEDGIIVRVKDGSGKDKFGYYLPGEEKYLLEPAFDEIEETGGYLSAFTADDHGSWALYSCRGEKAAESEDRFSLSVPDGRYLYSTGSDIIIDAVTGERAAEITPADGLYCGRLYDDGVCVLYAGNNTASMITDVFTGEELMECGPGETFVSHEGEYIAFHNRVCDREGSTLFDLTGLEEKNPEYREDLFSDSVRMIQVKHIDPAESTEVRWQLVLDGNIPYEERVLFCSEDLQILKSERLAELDSITELKAGDRKPVDEADNAGGQRFFKAQVYEEGITILLEDIITGDVVSFSFREPLPGPAVSGRNWMKYDNLLLCSYIVKGEDRSDDWRRTVLTAEGEVLFSDDEQEKVSCVTAVDPTMLLVRIEPSEADGETAGSKILFFRPDGTQADWAKDLP